MKKIAIAIVSVVLAVCMAVGLVACGEGGGNVTITLSETTLTMTVGDTETLEAETSDDSSVTWSTSDKTIADVNSRGRVTAMGAGEATITATSGEATATCKVTVKAKPVITISGLQETATVERGQTITLTATASDSSAIEWASGDTTIATVTDEGVVTGVFPGETTIIATTESGGRAECTLTVTAPAGAEGSWYEMTFGEESVSRGEKGNKIWYYWNDQNWTGSQVTLEGRPEYFGDSEDSEAGSIHFAYTSIGTSWFGMQIFYNDTSKADGTYELTATIDIDVAGTVTLNGNQIALTEGENTVEAIFVYDADSTNTEDSSWFDLQMGYLDAEGKGHMISAADVTISNLKWEVAEVTALDAPVVVVEDGEATITDDNNTEGVGSYLIGLFESAEASSPKYSFTVALNEMENYAIDTSMVEGATYYVRAMAVGESAAYTNSAWSSANDVTFVVADHEIAYDMVNTTEANIPNDTWIFWSEYNTATGRYENGTVTLNSTDAGGNWYSLQLFYKNTGLVAGTNYTLKLTITSTLDGTITVQGQAVELEANVAKEVTVTITGGTNVGIQLGTNPDAGGSGSAFGQNAVTVTLSNISFTEVQA